MLNINFVPDDYVENTEWRRTNMMYLVLFLITMIAFGASFSIIRVRYRSLVGKETLVNTKKNQIQESLTQFEDLQAKRKEMVTTALMTAELLEPVPRSVLLASLTNNLPPGTSLLRIKLIQKEPQTHNTVKVSPAGGKTVQAKPATAESEASPEKRLETLIDLEGIAPSDLQVAVYIEKLGNSTLLDNVALVESKEYKIQTGSQKQATNLTGTTESILRQFKLTAMLKKDVHLTKEDIKKIAFDTSAAH
jgi:hypothetical protein